MRYLDKSDFSHSPNVAGVMSTIASFRVPRENRMILDTLNPVFLRITAYQSFTGKNTQADFVVTPTHAPAELPDATKIAVAYGETSQKTFVCADLTDGALTFGGDVGGNASETVHVWYLLGEGRFRLTRYDAVSTEMKTMILDGSIKSVNLRDQYNVNDMITLPSPLVISPRSYLILEVETNARVELLSTSVTSQDINTVGMLSIPVEFSSSLIEAPEKE